MDVNQSMAKTVSTAEVQYLYASSTPGQAYVIKSEASNMGFPLSSSFRFDTVYYLSRGETENKCNLQIYGKIVFRKNGCGIKSLIEDSTIQGLSTYVEDLTRSLLQLTEPDLKNINISNSSSFLSKESIAPITEPIFVTRDRIIAGEKSLSLRIRSLSTSSSSLSHFELYYETNMNLDEAKLLTSNATLADIEKRLASGRGFETCIITPSGMENLVVTAAKSYKKLGTYTFPVGTTPILGETIVRELDPDEIMSTFGSS
uniref:VASt domain-containing protein n=1 Tax=Tetranychus urticae TaxID=32264 RepID=T1KPC1_TETUR